MIISVDWGISSLRIRLIDHPFTVIAERVNKVGVKQTHTDWLAAGQPPALPFYLERLSPLIAEIASDQVPIFLSGMASSSIGFCELPYASLPFALDGSSIISRQFDHVTLISGVASSCDIMRSEEMELIGLAAQGYGDGLYVIPGTHSKHCEVRNGRLIDFRSFMTGEIFAILRQHSILQASVAAGAPALDDSFRAGVTSNVPLLHGAITVRARQLLQATAPDENLAYLSGMLIACELRNLPDDQPLILAGGGLQQAAYAEALTTLGRDFLRIPQSHSELACAHAHLRLSCSWLDPA